MELGIGRHYSRERIVAKIALDRVEGVGGASGVGYGDWHGILRWTGHRPVAAGNWCILQIALLFMGRSGLK